MCLLLISLLNAGTWTMGLPFSVYPCSAFAINAWDLWRRTQEIWLQRAEAWLANFCLLPRLSFNFPTAQWHSWSILRARKTTGFVWHYCVRQLLCIWAEFVFVGFRKSGKPAYWQMRTSKHLARCRDRRQISGASEGTSSLKFPISHRYSCLLILSFIRHQNEISISESSLKHRYSWWDFALQVLGFPDDLHLCRMEASDQMMDVPFTSPPSSFLFLISRYAPPAIQLMIDLCTPLMVPLIAPSVNKWWINDLRASREPGSIHPILAFGYTVPCFHSYYWFLISWLSLISSLQYLPACLWMTFALESDSNFQSPHCWFSMCVSYFWQCHVSLWWWLHWFTLMSTLLNVIIFERKHVRKLSCSKPNTHSSRSILNSAWFEFASQVHIKMQWCWQFFMKNKWSWAENVDFHQNTVQNSCDSILSDQLTTGYAWISCCHRCYHVLLLPKSEGKKY